MDSPNAHWMQVGIDNFGAANLMTLAYQSVRLSVCED